MTKQDLDKIVGDLFDRAEIGDVSVLDDPNVASTYGYKENGKWTPLHRLAIHGHLEVLKHPMVDIVTDSDGTTPFYWLHYHLQQKYSEKGLRYMMKLIQSKKNVK